MTPIQLVFLLALLATWSMLMVPLLDRNRRATVHGSAAGFERAMAVLQEDATRPQEDTARLASTVTAPERTRTATGAVRTSAPVKESDNVGPVARERPTTVRAARRAISSDEQLTRLRQVFVGSLGAVFVTAAAAIAWAGPFWALFVVVTLATGGFVTVLRHRKLESDRAKAVIRSIRRDTQSFVGRDHPHAYEALPGRMEGLADPSHFGGLRGEPLGHVEVH